jgi:hypothetical protein
MKPIDFLLIGAVVLLLGTIVWFVIRSKKRGKKCIGCPNGGKCAACSGNCSYIDK